MNIFGIIGTALLAFAGIPQLLKTLKEGHAEGLSAATLWCWLIGLIAFLIYVVSEHAQDYVLLANYILSAVVVGLLIVWKHFPRRL